MPSPAEAPPPARAHPFERFASRSPVWALVLLTAISTCGFIDRIVMNVLVQPIKAEFRLSDTQIGLVAAVGRVVLIP